MKSYYIDLDQMLLSNNKEENLILKMYYDKHFSSIIDAIFKNLYNRIIKYQKEEKNIYLILIKIENLFQYHINEKKIKIIIHKYNSLLKSINLNKLSPPTHQILKSIYDAIESYRDNFQKIQDNLNKQENSSLFLLETAIFNIKNFEIVKKIISNDNKSLNIVIENNETILLKTIIHFCLLEDNDPEIEYFSLVIEQLLISKKNSYIYKEREKCLEVISNNISKKHVCSLYERVSNDSKINNLEKKYGINFTPSKRTKQEALGIKIPQDRIDYSTQNVITIDGEGSKCLDDGLYAEYNRDGTITLYIHISDIPSIINRYSLLDHEAKDKGETIYLIDREIPLYPYTICNDIASLLPYKRRSVITYKILLDSNLDFIGNDIDDFFKMEKGTIISKSKLDYQTADEILKYKNNDTSKLLDLLYRISHKLRKQNTQVELYHQLENLYEPNNLKLKNNESLLLNHCLSANIIQQMMILPNRLVPEYLSKKGLPCLFRINPYIDDQLISNCFNINQIISEEFQKDNKNYQKLKNICLSILANARFSSENKGHNGLGFNYYSQVTAPGRRYGDVSIEYALYELCFNDALDDATIYRFENYFNYLAEYLNQKASLNNNFCTEYNNLIRKKKKEKK